MQRYDKYRSYHGIPEIRQEKRSLRFISSYLVPSFPPAYVRGGYMRRFFDKKLNIFLDLHFTFYGKKTQTSLICKDIAQHSVKFICDKILAKNDRS